MKSFHLKNLLAGALKEQILLVEADNLRLDRRQHPRLPYDLLLAKLHRPAEVEEELPTGEFDPLRQGFLLFGVLLSKVLLHRPLNSTENDDEVGEDEEDGLGGVKYFSSSRGGGGGGTSADSTDTVRCQACRRHQGRHWVMRPLKRRSWPFTRRMNSSRSASSSSCSQAPSRASTETPLLLSPPRRAPSFSTNCRS
ncbi:hypothetical protein TYRP_018211 [Tyrophagus putrescentiae]|nr:hypothetical protein TYRP_018211 [Tyrophagus putrescentiae]